MQGNKSPQRPFYLSINIHDMDINIRKNEKAEMTSAPAEKEHRPARAGHPAARISLVLTLVLFVICAVFFLRGNGTSPETGSSASSASSGPDKGQAPPAYTSDSRSLLGLDTVLGILFPVPENKTAYTFSPDGSHWNQADAAAEKETAAAPKGPSGASGDNAAKTQDTGNSAGTKTAAVKADAAKKTAAKTADAKKADAGDTAAAAKETAAKSAESKKADTAATAAAAKETAAKTADAKKAAEAEKESPDKEAEKAKDSKDQKSDKDKDSSKKDSEKKDSNSRPSTLTKTQKKYIQAWEDSHMRDFPLVTGLHDYNWKYLEYDDQGVLHYRGDDDYKVRRGIDVSEFQGQIDWDKVKADGYDFVFIRACHRTFHTGSLEEDTRAVKNLKRAHKAGLDVGVYAFSQAVTTEESEEEAKLCLDIIKESGVKITLPVVFDPEIQIEYDARINYISNEQFTDNAVAFCKEVEKAGYTPAIYANSSTETDILDMSRLEDAEIWYADYNYTPESPYRFTFWQYTNTGWVDGIPETETDLNLWFVPREE